MRPYHPTPPAEVHLTETGGRPTLVFVRELNHPAPEVWTALTEPKPISAWAPFDTHTSLERLGDTTLTMAGDPNETKLPATVRRVEPTQVLEYTWGEDVLTWELENLGEHTRLTLTHITASRDQVPKMAAGWHLCLDVLERMLEGEAVPRIVGEAAREHGWEELRSGYAKTLGLNEG